MVKVFRALIFTLVYLFLAFQLYACGENVTPPKEPSVSGEPEAGNAAASESNAPGDRDDDSYLSGPDGGGDENALPEPSEDGYEFGYDESLICEDDGYYYYQVSEEILNEQDPFGDPETQDYIYRMKTDGTQRTMIYKAPEHCRIFSYYFAYRDWLYIAVDSWKPNSEGGPYGIARLNKKTFKFEMLASPDAYGLMQEDNSAYFFWHGDQDNIGLGGIYRINLDNVEIIKLADLPDKEISPTYGGGFIESIENSKLYFHWENPYETETGSEYALDLNTGSVRKEPAKSASSRTETAFGNIIGDKILYTNKKLGFSVELPLGWDGYYIIEETGERVSFNFRGKSKASQGYEDYDRYVNGLQMFYIGSESTLETYIDTIQKVGTALGIDYYYYTRTEYWFGCLDAKGGDSKEEIEFKRQDTAKEAEMEKDIEAILASFKEISAE